MEAGRDGEEGREESKNSPGASSEKTGCVRCFIVLMETFTSKTHLK